MEEGNIVNVLKVVIADDERIILEGMKRLYDWSGNGYEVVEDSMDGIDAVEVARRVRPDIMLLDINMPLLNGFEVIERLKTELPNTKFIIVSGYNDYNLMREAIKLQAFDYLLKPLHADALAKALQRARDEIFEQNNIKESSEKIDEDVPLYEQMKTYVVKHLDEKITLSVLSQNFNMNPDYISSYFKKKSGMNFSEYLNYKRISEAKKLLSKTDLSIGEISERVGFSDYRYFNKVFRNHLKVSPSQYRMECRERSKTNTN